MVFSVSAARLAAVAAGATVRRMRHDRPSLTAMIVALGRGVGLDEEFRDPIAMDLCPPPLDRWLRSHWARPLSPVERRLLRRLTWGLVDHVTLRMAAIDAAMDRGLREGCKQLVILGAGLDARGLRVDGLATVAVYEVDHPATQAYKKARLATRGRGADRELHFVPVDFSRDALDQQLLAAGFEVALPTFWVWEGVTQYLTPQAIEQTLEVVAALSSPGSTLAMTYVAREETLLLRALMVLTGFGLAAIGEPLTGVVETPWLVDALESHGFSLRDNSAIFSWAAAASRETMNTPLRMERLTVSTRNDR